MIVIRATQCARGTIEWRHKMTIVKGSRPGLFTTVPGFLYWPTPSVPPLGPDLRGPILETTYYSNDSYELIID